MHFISGGMHFYLYSLSLSLIVCGDASQPAHYLHPSHMQLAERPSVPLWEKEKDRLNAWTNIYEREQRTKREGRHEIIARYEFIVHTKRILGNEMQQQQWVRDPCVRRPFLALCVWEQRKRERCISSSARHEYLIGGISNRTRCFRCRPHSHANFD